MREDNYSDKQKVEFLTNQIWKSINILRGVLPIEHHHVYLFLLSAYYDRIIKKEFLDGGNDYLQLIYNALDSKPGYSELMDVYFPIIDNIPRRNLGNLLHQFSWLDLNMPEHNFDEIFDILLFQLADFQGKYSGEFLLPFEISQFLIKIADIPRGAKVFNPFAGLASFAIHLENNEQYYGQEISRSTWALGMLRLMRKQSDISIEYRVEDSIQNWPHFDHFDLVISNPPFGLKIDPSNITQGIKWNKTMLPSSVLLSNKSNLKITSEQYVMQKGLESVNYDGKVICVASIGTLFRGGAEGRFRKYLIEEGLVDTVISLPGGLLKQTGIAICILILTKKRNTDKVIRLVDGTNFVIDNGRKDKRLDNEKLLNYIRSYNNHEFVRQISIDRIRKNNYNLSVQRYLLDEFDGVSLKNVTKSIQVVRAVKGTFGKLITTSNLKDDDVDYHLNINEINERELPSHSTKIGNSCLLVSTRWKSLKPTLFEYSDTPIYIGLDILALEIDDQNIDPHYLVSELRSTNVLNQVSAYQNTGAIHFLNRSDFFDIKVKVPPLLEQKAKVKVILELSQKFKALQNERNALVHGQQIKSFDEFASLKHSLGAPRQNILSNAKSLIRFFETNDAPEFDEVKKRYAERYETNLIEDLIQIKEDINHISIILEKGEQGLILSNYELRPIAITEINKVLKKSKKSKGTFNPKYEELSNQEMTGKAIEANITLFQIFLDNIFSNANKYAFKEKSNKNEVIIELKVTEDVMQMKIKNNGNPFPKNYNKEKFIAKFSTANPEKGTGLGGYDINRIAEYFNNPDWDLILNENDPFPVYFEFNFPVIPMINE